MSELYLAFRQAKATLLFERNGVSLVDLAEFEGDLANRLEGLRSTLHRNGGWFDDLPPGDVWVVPKRVREERSRDDGVIRMGVVPREHELPDLDVQLRFSPSPEIAIVEVLFLREFGPTLQSLLSRNVIGYRLDLRGGELEPTRRWLFEYWPQRYQEFRIAPLKAARNALKNPLASVVVVSADFASFYDSIESDFLLQEQFVESLSTGDRAIDALRYRKATESLLALHSLYRRQASRKIGLPIDTGIPIGALTSRVVANLALATFDDAITARQDVISYRRYVDDFVIVAKAGANESADRDAVLSRYVPHMSKSDEGFEIDSVPLGRAGSTFQLQNRKVRVQHLQGADGVDFLDVVEGDFERVVSEGRSFLETSVLLDDASARLVRAGGSGKSPLRVLRDADRTRLEKYGLRTVLRSLERVSSLVDREETLDLMRRTLGPVGRLLENDAEWPEHIDLTLGLLGLTISGSDSRLSEEWVARTEAAWGSIDALKSSVHALYHRGRKVPAAAAWVWLRNYLHERRLETVCGTLPPGAGTVERKHWRRFQLTYRTSTMGIRALYQRAQLLAASDLRARDREDDGFSPNARDSQDSQWMMPGLAQDNELIDRLNTIADFSVRCSRLGDHAWGIAPARLFLCTRPPSYFDVARRWLYRSEVDGFDDEVFDTLLGVVNAVRGTAYTHPVGSVVNASTIRIPAQGTDEAEDETRDPRLVLGNTVVPYDAFRGALHRVPGSPFGRPLLTLARLRGLAEVVRQTARVSRGHETLLVLPELAIPRKWFRTLANHVVRFERFGLVAGLEYRHHLKRPIVYNQVYAVLPGPYSSVAAWAWTKRLPAREEANELANEKSPLRFPTWPAKGLPRVVVDGPYGRFSVLICSELIEARRTADLLGRVELILAPSWNKDTASYENLIQSVGLQLHAIVGVANTGTYSDCRAWAPKRKRWARDLCRLIQRESNSVVFVDLPIRSLREFHSAHLMPAPPTNDKNRSEWRPLPPDWP